MTETEQTAAQPEAPHVRATDAATEPVVQAESEPSVANDVSEPRSTKRSPEKAVWYRLRRAAHRRLPGLFSHPVSSEAVRAHRKRDAEENAETAPPADEFVDLRCLWAVEFYTPAHIDQLLASFRRLGWDKEDYVTATDPGQWLQQLRERPYGGGWLNFGTIVRPDARGVFGINRTAPLPEHVKNATGKMYSLTSSLTCVCIGFEFTETFARQFDDALRLQRHTYTKPSRRGYQIIGPESQKVAHVRDIRKQMQRSALTWFQKHMPGLFASGLLEGGIPTCEFVSLRQSEPFTPRDKTSRWPSYLFTLGIEHDIDAWLSADAPGLKFAWPSARRGDNPYHAILAIKEEAMSEERIETWGSGRDGQINYVDLIIQGLLGRWAILPMLNGYARHLNAIRDSTALRPSARTNALKVLDSLSRHVSYNADIAAVTSELIPFAENAHLFEHDVASFKPVRPDLCKNASHTLADGIRISVLEQAKWLQKSDLSVRDHLTQYGSLLGSNENVKLQRQLGTLTWIIVVLTVAILLLTFLALVAAAGEAGEASLLNFIGDYWPRLF